MVGAGSLGFHHVRILREVEDVKLCGFVESRAERAAQVESSWVCDPIRISRRMLDDVDAVTIAVPTPSHFDVAKQALERGKHAFIEKPITTTLDEADELLQYCARKRCDRSDRHVERFNRA